MYKILFKYILFSPRAILNYSLLLLACLIILFVKNIILLAILLPITLTIFFSNMVFKSIKCNSMLHQIITYFYYKSKYKIIYKGKLWQVWMDSYSNKTIISYNNSIYIGKDVIYDHEDLLSYIKEHYNKKERKAKERKERKVVINMDQF